MFSLKCLSATVLLAITFSLCVNASESPQHEISVVNRCPDTMAYVVDANGQVVPEGDNTGYTPDGSAIYTVTVKDDINSFSAFLIDASNSTNGGLVNNPQIEFSMEPNGTSANEFASAKVQTLARADSNPGLLIEKIPTGISFYPPDGCDPSWLNCDNDDSNHGDRICTEPLIQCKEYSAIRNLNITFC